MVPYRLTSHTKNLSAAIWRNRPPHVDFFLTELLAEVVNRPTSISQLRNFWFFAATLASIPFELEDRKRVT